MGQWHRAAAEAEAQTEARGNVHHLVGAFDLQLQRLAHAVPGQEPLALRHAVIGEDGLDLRHRAGIARAARRRNLRAAPCALFGFMHMDSGIGGHIRLELVRVGEAVVHRFAFGRRNEFGDTIIFRRGQADPEIGVQRFGDFLAENRADGFSGDAADDFADEIALRQRVIAGRGARLPERRLRGEQRCGLLPIVEIFLGDLLFPAGQTGGMAHQLRDGDAFLAVGGEFRPVFRHRRLEVYQPAIRKDERGQRRHRLGGGIDVDDGVFHPRLRLRRVGIAAPQIDNGFAVLRHAIGRAEIAEVLEIVLEGLANLFEALVGEAVDFNHIQFPYLSWPAKAGHPGDAAYLSTVTLYAQLGGPLSGGP